MYGSWPTQIPNGYTVKKKFDKFNHFNCKAMRRKELSSITRCHCLRYLSIA